MGGGGNKQDKTSNWNWGMGVGHRLDWTEWSWSSVDETMMEQETGRGYRTDRAFDRRGGVKVKKKRARDYVYGPR